MFVNVFVRVESYKNIDTSIIRAVFQSFRFDKSRLIRCSVRKHASAFHRNRWEGLDPKEQGRQGGRQLTQAGRSKKPISFYTVLPRGGYLSHPRKSQTASEAQTVIARVYNRQALILIVPLSPPLPPNGGISPPGPDVRSDRVTLGLRLVAGRRSPTYLDGRATWTEPGRWTWTEEGRGASHH